MIALRFIRTGADEEPYRLTETAVRQTVYTRRVWEPRWHPWSEEHVARHGVSWEEVEEALLPPTVSRPARDGTTVVLGQTFAGRHLALVVAPDDDAPTVSVITARLMTDRERGLYRARLTKE